MTTALLAPTEHSLLSTPPLCPVSIPAAVRAGTSDSTVLPLCQERTYPEILRSQQCRLVIVLARPQRLHRGWQKPAARISERLRSGFPADARALLRSQSGAYAGEWLRPKCSSPGADACASPFPWQLLGVAAAARRDKARTAAWCLAVAHHCARDSSRRLAPVPLVLYGATRRGEAL